jgi:serine/threonine-protein kinase
MADSSDLDVLGRYKLLDRIGAGGVGEVFRARDTRLGRTVAVKVADARIADDPAARAQFLQDGRASASLSHPNIAAVYEVGDEAAGPYLVLEYVPGQTLAQIISGAPLNPRRAVDFGVQLADALADAHAAGVVHRDLKPDNIIVTPKGNAKILDFGLVYWTAGGRARMSPAEAGPAAVVSTLPYLSPEQALGEPGDYRTDIFSLGAILFEMFTGKPPFADASARGVTMKVVQAVVPTPTALNRNLPKEVDAVIGKAMAKSVDQRYESAASLAADLRSIAAALDRRSETLEIPTPIEPSKPSVAGWIAAVIMLVAITALVWFATRV